MYLLKSGIENEARFIEENKQIELLVNNFPVLRAKISISWQAYSSIETKK
jgi:hypothetical protein